MSEDDGEEYRQSQAEITEAWNQPAFSFDTIAADPWTAVYLPIPENADRALLEHAHSWAVDLRRYVDEAMQNPNAQNAYGGPFGGAFEGGSQQEFFEDAGARVDTLGAMIGEAALQDAAAVDPEKVEQARKLLGMAGDMHSHYDVSWQDGGFAVVRTFEIEDALLPEYGVPAEQTVYRADTIDALVDKVIAVEGWRLKAENAAGVEQTPKMMADTAEAYAVRDAGGSLESLGGYLSRAVTTPLNVVIDYLADELPGKLENLGAHLSRAVTTALNVVIGYFVDEPKLTAAQVHDTLQAAGNVETIHAREVAAASALDAVEHEGRMLAMKGDQQAHDVRLAETLGVNATAEATIGLDEHEGARRSQKLSL